MAYSKNPWDIWGSQNNPINTGPNNTLNGSIPGNPASTPGNMTGTNPPNTMSGYQGNPGKDPFYVAPPQRTVQNNYSGPPTYDPSKLNSTWFGSDNPLGASTKDAYYTTNPQAGYLQYLNNTGLGGNTNQGLYAQGQYQRYYNNYLSYLPYMDPAHNQFLDYLYGAGKTSNPGDEYNALGASNRGDSINNVAPRVRWSAPS